MRTIAPTALVLVALLLSVPAPVDAAEVRAATADRQIELLESQLTAIREYNSSLLQTVYWSLGVVVVLAVALVGFGWFTNFRVYERDKNSIRQELLTRIQLALHSVGPAQRIDLAT
jgi:hypothetical protein